MTISPRNEQTMMQIILDVARLDDRIRAVVLNGSRANPHAKKDPFQDYDIVYVVEDVRPFVEDRDWLEPFGPVLIMQMPDEMDGVWENNKDRFAYLMLFEDGNRIDLTLFRKDRMRNLPVDSQSILLLDKDQDMGEYDPPSDKDYLPQMPSEREFHNCCNEFRWVATYVVKGVWRKEITYAKCMLEKVVREELIRMLIWYAGMKTDFKKNMGYCGKYLAEYIEPGLWYRFLATYTDTKEAHMWDGLVQMCHIFEQVAQEIAERYGYSYDAQEHQRVVQYIHAVRKASESN